MKAVYHSQGSSDWLDWRNGGIGGSDIAVIMGVSPWKTRYQLWLEKTGKAPPPKKTEAMARGNLFEPAARAYFEEQLDTEFYPTCGEREDKPHHKGSFDGISMDGEILEIKVPMLKALEVAKSGVIPDYYIMQDNWLMYISGATRCYHGTYDPVQTKGYYKLITRDDALIEEMVAAADEFWWHVQENEAPEIDEKEHVIVDDEQIIALSEIVRKRKLETKAAKDTAARLKKLEDEAVKELLDHLDDGNAIVGKIKVTRVEKDSFDYKRMAEENNIDVEKYRKPSIGYPVITVIKDTAK